MKRLPIVLSTLFALALFTAAPTFAQHEQQRGQHEQQRGQQRGQAAQTDTMPAMMQGMMSQGMMGPGMMGPGMMQMMHGMHQQMMQNPLHRASMSAFMLPALADTLGLSDEQRQTLDALKGELTDRRRSSREQAAARHEELSGLFEEGARPGADQVRQHLEEMAELRADRQAALYETAQQMREVLTDEQRQTLDEMTPQEQMHQVMANMTMQDMMQMMRSMHGGMMSGGMMDQSMMQGGMMQHRGMGPGMMKRDTMRQNRP